ncbi:hypothetical protein [Sphingomonas montana]|uniref:hypothetical protein n=1 Tax=Sphingomonas montana TaxID=1843236 RepID=UPI00096C6344|nr:hypothetical protein [Sphingomonas montana]
MRLDTGTRLAMLAAPLAMVPAGALAQSTGLDDLVGARAGQAEAELERRGYRNVGGEKGDDRSYTYWWSGDRRQCVTIATMDGRYNAITPSPAPDCRQPASVRPNRDYQGQPASRPRPGFEPDPRYGRPDPRYQNQPASRPRPGYEPDPAYGRPSYRPGGDRPIYPAGGLPVVGGRPVELGLVCFGDGSRNGIASGTTWTWNAAHDRYEHGRYNQSTTEMFDASLMVQTWAGGGRIRLPRSLIPPINARGNSGWWDLNDVSVGRDVIRATYRLNGLNKPRLTIDRRRGRITVEGTGSYGFRGTCDVIGEPRRF